MAREWQPASSFSLMPNQSEAAAGDSLALSRSVSRNWSATRGAVLWEGAVDLAGSFPGFANWGSRAQSVHLTLTDRYLLVDEGTHYGFGLPIGWLSAAQALTGVEPVATETDDHLRVCYLDGNRVRGFSLRVRGGRFGSRSARRANLLRSAAISLGLASTTPSADLLLPPEHDLSLDWDDFASYESEPVIWSGRAAMPVGSGLESSLCDVWLTSASLIWGASSRAGIYRIATGSLAAIMTAETPGYEPVIYWTVGGSHQTHVDLPMIFARPDRNDPELATRESLVALLESHGHQIDSPASPPQPWLPVIDTPHTAESAVSPAPEGNPVLASSRLPESVQIATDHVTRSVEASRRRLMDDGLFPERVPPTLPRSSPRPWGDRVERVGDEAPSSNPPDDLSTSPIPVDPSPEQKDPVSDHLRVWPPAVPRRKTPPSSRDATAMLVRRPRVRATTTEEFLASEQAARAAASDDPSTGPTIETTPESEIAAVRPARPERGVMVRFRRPETAVAGLVETIQRASDTVVARSTSSFRVARTESGNESTYLLALESGIGNRAPIQRPAEPSEDAAGQADRRSATAPVVPDGEFPKPTVAGSMSIAMTGTSQIDDPTGIGAACQAQRDAVTAQAEPSHLTMMRSAQSMIDAQLAIASRSLEQSPSRSDQPEIAATAPILTRALTELEAAITAGELTSLAAESHRDAITRSADTAERLRSLLDLYAREYLSLPELVSRREALLGRACITNQAVT